jgi:internalin A
MFRVRQIIFSILLVLLCMVLPLNNLVSLNNSIVTAQETTVSFPDINLEVVIRDLIHKSSGDIYSSDLAQITTIIAQQKSISNLSGIEYCDNLTYLYLDDNQISDISPLSDLIDLKELSLSSNSISNISPLSALYSLQYLFISGNLVSDLSPISHLSGLEYLELHENQISDISPLSELTNLIWLTFDSNSISNISAISMLNSLQHLSADNNQISQLSPLSSLTNLIFLSLNNNQVSNISPLSMLTNLIELYLSTNSILDVSPLDSQNKLAYLDLSGNQISNISAFANLINLKSLNLNNNHVYDIVPISSLIGLESLFLESNEISNISPLNAFIYIQSLNLNNNQIADISSLADNSGIGFNDYVNISNNNLDLQSYSPDMLKVDYLINRGVFINYEPQNIIYNLALIIKGSGSVSKEHDQTNYSSGTSVRLTAIPDSGWEFFGWSGDLAGKANSVDLVMNSDKEITANFIRKATRGGSGGGGSGPNTTNVALSGLIGNKPLAITGSGWILEDNDVHSIDGRIHILIRKNTQLLDSSDKYLKTLSAVEIANLQNNSLGTIILMAYDLGPDGAKFLPSLKVVMNYEGINLPVELIENTLHIAWWNETEWERLDSIIDTNSKTVSTMLPHLSRYALLGTITLPAPTPSELPATSTIIQSTTSITTFTPTPSLSTSTSVTFASAPKPQTSSTTPEPTTSRSQISPNWVLISIICVLFALALVIFVVVRKRSNK